MINCSVHPQKEASGACVYCGKFFCEDCLVEIENKFYCKEHVKTLVQSPRQPEAAGHAYHDGGEYRETPPPYPNIYVNNSNTTQMGYAPGYYYPYKSRGIAILLCFFLGWGGFHRFYTGKIGTGVLWLFTGGFFVIGWAIDLLFLILGIFKDANGQPLV